MKIDYVGNLLLDFTQKYIIKTNSCQQFSKKKYFFLSGTPQ